MITSEPSNETRRRAVDQAKDSFAGDDAAASYHHGTQVSQTSTTRGSSLQMS